ncbi:histidine kinase dimerization/phospho-acceptor domain-containing protein [Nereida sp.]|uniref:histidine kinase dimerization/phospho-acceptor domain-containing protein n=1 Tax=Nereida sp. TaxID=2736090 RepID=UPI003F6A0101
MSGLLLLSANGLRNARMASIRDQDELEYKNAQLRDEVLYQKSAEAAAKKADDAKSRFLAVMSHEVRTPLNAIMGMFELIERADVPERQKRQAFSGRRSAERLFSELTKVLDVSRLDADVVTITPHRSTRKPGHCGVPLGA